MKRSYIYFYLIQVSGKQNRGRQIDEYKPASIWTIFTAAIDPFALTRA